MPHAGPGALKAMARAWLPSSLLDPFLCLQPEYQRERGMRACEDLTSLVVLPH